MRTINIPLGDQLFPLVAPAHAAAFAVAETSPTAVTLIFRMKAQHQLTDIEAINEAKKLFPNLKWRAVSSNPGVPTRGGVGPADPRNGYLKLEKVRNLWTLVSTETLQAYLSTQNELGADQASLPAELTLQDEALEKLVGAVSAQLGALKDKVSTVTNS